MRRTNFPAMEEFEPFPVYSLVPKRETGVDRFLTKYKEYDGSGVIIAILDTGIDPSAAGLQNTTNGEPKILDLIDASGSGDVDTSHVCTGSLEFTGLSGRQLKIPSHWENPSGKWHVGVKAAYELFPSTLVSRLQSSYTEKEWNPVHQPALANANRELAEFDAKHSKEKLTLMERLQREELQSRCDLLSNPSNKATNPGPVFDCVVFHDGETWRAAIDTTETGDFSSATLLAPYIYTHQFARFGEDDQMNYSINIYNNGDILSVVTSGGSHGTHVACIAAANFPDNPEKNGMAPGAQIVGIKIGDTRLSTMETAPSLIRAASEAARAKVDVVNFSYGEACHWVDKGKIIEQFRLLIEKHNITFVSSAGNNGPCLSTIGCPGANASSIIGIGAVVSSNMMAGEYSMLKKKPSTHYTWSSRGPVVDGHLGVSVCAPGGAITSVPRWTLKKEQLMNGTSMSSPSACGAVALLQSALKHDGIVYTPAMIKRSLENTALPLLGGDKFSSGNGVVQIDKAYEYIKQNWENNSPAMNVNFKVTVLTGGKTLRGVYLREAHEVVKSSNHVVQVEPAFPKDTDPSQKLSLDLHLALISSDSWLNTPPHLALHNCARQFAIEVDPTGLPPGAHYAEVCAVDVSKCFQGALFRVPVTVIVPSQMSQQDTTVFVNEDVDFQKKGTHRFFLRVPLEATWAEINLTSKNHQSPSRVTVQTVQLPPMTSYCTNETYHTVKLEPSGSSTIIAPLTGGYMMELCCTQYWSDLSDASVSLKVTFHSLHPDTSTLKLHCGDSWTRMDVTCNYRQEEFSPELKFTHYVLVKRPHDHVIQPLGERDVLLSGEQLYELKLDYHFHVPKSGSEIRPVSTLLSKFLYESPYAGQFWMIYNSQKKLVCSGDALPHQYSTKLDKGDYTVKLQVVHEKRTTLESLKDMVMTLEVKLSSSISVDLFPTMADALSSSNKWHSKKLASRSVVSIFITNYFEDKLPRNYQSGDLLKGKLTLSKADNVKKEVHYPVQYMLSEKPKKSPARQSATSSTSSSSSSSSIQEYDKALKDLKLQWMKKKVVNISEMESEFGTDLDFLMAKLSCCVEDKTCQYQPTVASLVAEVYKQVNMQEVLAHCGTKMDLSVGASDKQSQMEKAKKILIDCLLSEGAVIARELSTTDPSSTHSDRMSEIYVTLHQLLDSKDTQLRSFRIQFARVLQYNAILAKLLEEESSETGPNKDRDLELIKVFSRLGWGHYSTALRRWLPRNYPANYQPF